MNPVSTTQASRPEHDSNCDASPTLQRGDATVRDDAKTESTTLPQRVDRIVADASRDALLYLIRSNTNHDGE